MKATTNFLFGAMIYALIFSAGAGAHADSREKSDTPVDSVQKLLNLEQKIQTAAPASCVPEGLDCTSSIECCGSATCWRGACNNGGSSCRGEGATCGSSIDCCGALTCWRGRCDDGGSSCYPKGAICKSSIECCGSLTCWQGRCD